MFGNRYQDLLESIFEGRQISQEYRGAYLKELKPFAEELWDAFRNNHVTVDWLDTKIQDVYLLRYYLQYGYLTWYVINKLADSAKIEISARDDAIFEACLFGCGPAPEILGLIGTTDYPGIVDNLLCVSLFDLHEEWSHSHRIVFPRLLPKDWDANRYEIFPEQVDLCSVGISNKVLNRVKTADLVLFQNCMNELRHDTNSEHAVQRNIETIFASMIVGSSMIIIDRGNYDSEEFLESFIPGLSPSTYNKDDGKCNFTSIRGQLPDEIHNSGLFQKRPPFRRNKLDLAGSCEYIAYLVRK